MKKDYEIDHLDDHVERLNRASKKADGYEMTRGYTSIFAWILAHGIEYLSDIAEKPVLLNLKDFEGNTILQINDNGDALSYHLSNFYKVEDLNDNYYEYNVDENIIKYSAVNWISNMYEFAQNNFAYFVNNLYSMNFGGEDYTIKPDAVKIYRTIVSYLKEILDIIKDKANTRKDKYGMLLFTDNYGILPKEWIIVYDPEKEEYALE